MSVQKKHSIELIKINVSQAYLPNEINSRITAPSTHYIDNIFREDDPKCLFIALNEFSYNISKDSSDIKTACYWIEWIIEYEIIRKKMKESYTCDIRDNVNIDEKFHNDSVWIIWEIILFHSNCKSKFIRNLLNSLMNLFCLKYTTSVCKK